MPPRKQPGEVVAARGDPKTIQRAKADGRLMPDGTPVGDAMHLAPLPRKMSATMARPRRCSPRDIWLRIETITRGTGILRVTDELYVRQLCIIMSMMSDLETKMGTWSPSRARKVKPDDAAAMRREWLRLSVQADRMMREMGLNPAARSRLRFMVAAADQVTAANYDWAASKRVMSGGA